MNTSKLITGVRRVCININLKRTFSFASEKTGNKAPKRQILLLAIPVTTFCLGTWQVYRLQWKKNLIKQMEERTGSTPVDMPDNLEDLKEMEYRRVTVKGVFDHSKEVILGPRSLTGGPTQGGRSNSGYHIITPLEIENGIRILINRGWIDRKKVNADTRLKGQVEGPVEITGFVRKGEKKRMFMPKNDPEHNRWYFTDVDGMAEHLQTAPVLLDADARSSISGGPIGGQTRVTLRNEHLQYILTWYSLTVATAYMYYRFRKFPAAAFGQKTSR